VFQWCNLCVGGGLGFQWCNLCVCVVGGGGGWVEFNGIVCVWLVGNI
jgi:hypothetical protein